MVRVLYVYVQYDKNAMVFDPDVYLLTIVLFRQNSIDFYTSVSLPVNRTFIYMPIKLNLRQ